MVSIVYEWPAGSLFTEPRYMNGMVLKCRAVHPYIMIAKFPQAKLSSNVKSSGLPSDWTEAKKPL